jgi:ferric-dicitrate binding protein FerR (iron transport regulator)
MNKLAAAILLIMWPAMSWAANFTLIGHVDLAREDALATSPSQSRQLSEGSEIFEGEVLSTGPTGRLHVTLIDGTALTLGGNSTLELSKFLLESPEPAGRLDLGAGTFRIISGKINKISGGTLEVHSDMAAMAIRGTDFYARQDAENLTLMLNDNGIIDVEATGALGQKRTLDQRGATMSVGLGGQVSDQAPAEASEKRAFMASLAAPTEYGPHTLIIVALGLYALVMLSYNRYGR